MSGDPTSRAVVETIELACRDRCGAVILVSEANSDDELDSRGWFVDAELGIQWCPTCSGGRVNDG